MNKTILKVAQNHVLDSTSINMKPGHRSAEDPSVKVNLPRGELTKKFSSVYRMDSREGIYLFPAHLTFGHASSDIDFRGTRAARMVKSRNTRRANTVLRVTDVVTRTCYVLPKCSPVVTRTKVTQFLGICVTFVLPNVRPHILTRACYV